MKAKDAPAKSTPIPKDACPEAGNHEWADVTINGKPCKQCSKCFAVEQIKTAAP